MFTDKHLKLLHQTYGRTVIESSRARSRNGCVEQQQLKPESNFLSLFRRVERERILKQGRPKEHVMKDNTL